jgi:hypothetical protein
MFHLYQPEFIEWPVSVDLPAKGGVKKPYRFTAHFRVLDEEDCDALQAQEAQMVLAMRHRLELLQGYAKDDPERPAFAEPLPCTYEDLADEVLCGWGDEVVGQDGEPVEFSDASKAKMYRVQGAAQAIYQAWRESLGKPSEKSAAKAGGLRAKN